jgi:hypothetical protein
MYAATSTAIPKKNGPVYRQCVRPHRRAFATHAVHPGQHYDPHDSTQQGLQ